MRFLGEDMKDIVLITNFWHFENEKSSSRYRTMAEMITDNSMQLEVITSTFYHLTKKQRNYDDNFLKSFSYKITLIPECGYVRNISLRRLKSHRQFGKNVLTYLQTRKKPDIIYLVVPSLDVADYVSRFASENHIPLVVDIQDLWPEAFKMALNIPLISDIIFAPMVKKANRVYRRADKIIAVSDTYVQRGLSVNSKDSTGLSVYIGTDFQLAKENMSSYTIDKPKSEFWITYIGALGRSYNIKLIIDALKGLQQKGINNIVFKVMGYGELMDEYKSYAKKMNVNVEFLGQTEYGKMMAILSSSDLAVNPIISTSVSTIINKVADYAAAGIPVINTQNSEEYRQLIDQYQAGINCKSDDVEEVVEAILKIYNDEKLRNQMRVQSRRLGIDKFDRRNTYLKIIQMLRRLS